MLTRVHRNARIGLEPTASLSAISSPFDSLFKVLFVFPSRYLFAIGLLLIFSFRWNLPPTWSCTRKQLDSVKVRPSDTRVKTRDGTCTLCGPPFDANYAFCHAQGASPLDYNSAQTRI